MTIMLLADNEKKELLTQFCLARREVLRRHRLLTAKTLAKAIEDEAGLSAEGVMDPVSGGFQQVSAFLSCGEADLLILFRDPNGQEDPDEYAMLSMCDRHMIPVATNIATADMLMYTVERTGAVFGQ